MVIPSLILPLHIHNVIHQHGHIVRLVEVITSHSPCRGSQITILLDGEKVLTREGAGLRAGAVGFCAAGSMERGLFRNIALQQLE